MCCMVNCSVAGASFISDKLKIMKETGHNEATNGGLLTHMLSSKNLTVAEINSLLHELMLAAADTVSTITFRV